MRIGFLNGNHTTKTFKSIEDVISYLHTATSQDLHPIEMAFYDDKHLHTKYQETDLDFKNRCVEFFQSHIYVKPCNIPLAINLDGTMRQKNDPYDYGLNEYDAEREYHDSCRAGE